jgi:sulfane dehydrogenase subunit SoxC
MPRHVLDPSSGFRRIPLQPHQLVEPVTPTPDVFVLAHLGVPHVDDSTWTLEIDGLVRRPRRYTLSELKRYPKREIQSVHQCAGNPLKPQIPTRRVANIIWSGVDLTTLLDEAEVERSATYLWSYGADYGEFEGTYCDWYLKDLPLERLAAGDSSWPTS